MRFSPNSVRQGLSLAVDTWRLRWATLRALTVLVAARLLAMAVPFTWLRLRLGHHGSASAVDLVEARRLAAHVDRAALRVGGLTRCLHRAMALSWQLRRCEIAHSVVLAARPAGQRRQGGDDLHAWVECGGATILGDLPGPWLELLRLPLRPPAGRD